MKQGAIAELASVFQMLPKPNEVGIDDFLDFFAATMRIPNIASDEQARIDEYILGFMPFSQPDFILQVMKLPLSERQNNRFFKTMIRKNDPSLTQYPLVKNNISYPFSLTTLQSRFWTKAKELTFRSSHDQTVHLFLETTKEFVLDTVNSTSVKQCPHYDYPSIADYVRRYYNGEKKLGVDVDWWIAFDAWRTMVEK